MSAESPECWTVLELLNWTKGYFERAGLPSPRLAAEILLAHVLDCERIDLYARFDSRPTAEQRGAFRELVRRAGRREPVAYIVGRKEFYSLPLKVTPDVLVPRAETEILVSEAISHLRSLGRAGRMWDACTGSGCIAVAVAVNVPDVTVLATDVSPLALAVAGRNAETSGVAGRVHFAVADLLCLGGDIHLPEDFDVGEPFDVIAANPPYVADGAPVGEEVRHEPSLALRGGQDGLDFLRPVIAEAPGYLARGGALIIEFGYDQADAVRDLIVSSGAFVEPKVLRDHQEIERAAVAIKR